MDNPALRDRMAAAALSRVKQLGGWDTYGDRVDSIYRELLSRHNMQPHEAS